MVCSLPICPIERSVVPPSLAHALGQLVGGGENRVGLLVEHQMIVAEMPAADVPVKVLGLQVKREGVGQQNVEAAEDILSTAACGRSVGVSRSGDVLSDLALLTMHLPVRKPGWLAAMDTGRRTI